MVHPHYRVLWHFKNKIDYSNSAMQWPQHTLLSEKSKLGKCVYIVQKRGLQTDTIINVY